MALIGITEVASILGISVKHAHYLSSNNRSFPLFKRLRNSDERYGVRHWEDHEIRNWAKSYKLRHCANPIPVSSLDAGLCAAFLHGKYDRVAMQKRYLALRRRSLIQCAKTKSIRLSDENVSSDRDANHWAGLI